MAGFLPDGGTALWMKRIHLPRSLSFTYESVMPIFPWDAEQSYISFEYGGFLFSLVVGIDVERLMALIDGKTLVTFEWVRVGRVEVSRTTGECFRPVFARWVA